MSIDNISPLFQLDCTGWVKCDPHRQSQAQTTHVSPSQGDANLGSSTSAVSAATGQPPREPFDLTVSRMSQPCMAPVTHVPLSSLELQEVRQYLNDRKWNGQLWGRAENIFTGAGTKYVVHTGKKSKEESGWVRTLSWSPTRGYNQTGISQFRNMRVKPSGLHYTVVDSGIDHQSELDESSYGPCIQLCPKIAPIRTSTNRSLKVRYVGINTKGQTPDPNGSTLTDSNITVVLQQVPEGWVAEEQGSPEVGEVGEVGAASYPTPLSIDDVDDD